MGQRSTDGGLDGKQVGGVLVGQRSTGERVKGQRSTGGGV